MASPAVGTELDNPVAGSRTVFLATAESTEGEYVDVEATYASGSRRPPLHQHPSQREDFVVRSGAMVVVRADETFTVKAGERFSVDPGVAHQMWNEGDEPASMLWRTCSLAVPVRPVSTRPVNNVAVLDPLQPDYAASATALIRSSVRCMSRRLRCSRRTPPSGRQSFTRKVSPRSNDSVTSVPPSSVPANS